MKPKIYTVATAHLDTSWNWDFETTLREYLPKTLKENFDYFRRFPEYEFSFEGSYRYELMEEYYPENFETMKEYIAAGRWHVSGSSFENGDMNIPSPESLIRNITYGNGYFNEKFGKRSLDIYLPDCFGFGWALPSIAAHCGLKGFTTQKLVWSSAYGVPFDIGKWYGVDGNWIYASPDARDYNGSLKKVRNNLTVKKKLADNIKNYNLPYAEILHGIGDRGGAPRENSVVATCIEARQNKYDDVDVYCASTDRLFRDLDSELTDEQKAALPEWHNELIFTDHAVGSYTSRAQSKRFNRRCEQLGDAAERMSVAATLLGGEYPQQNLNLAWKKTIMHQFHDDITGTSLNICYKRNWNDYVQALNIFSEEYRASAATVAAAADTSFAKGIPVFVFNPVQNPAHRVGSVSAQIDLPKGKRFARVYDSEGREVYAQTKHTGGKTTVTFSAKIPSVGFRIYDIRPSDKVSPLVGGLYASEKIIENENIKVCLDKNGDICSIIDKSSGRETLSAPIRMELHKYDGSLAWPAWEMNYAENMAEPIAYAKSPVFSLEDYGASRVAIKTVRRACGSIFTQIVSLDSGAKAVNVYNEVDWRSTRTMLKASFPLAAKNKKAAYDLGLGAIERTNSRPRLYEVPAQMWADITNTDGSFGASIFSDSRAGWDKPTDSTLRLTCMHTPRNKYRDESAQNLLEIGLNRFSFSIYPHEGDWSENGTQIAANEFNQPLAAFAVSRHKGSLGREFSFAGVNNENAIIRAIKKAQYSDEIVVRINEGSKKECNGVELYIGNGIESATELYGDERFKQPAEVENGKLVFDLKPYEIKTFALKLKKFDKQPQRSEYEPLKLRYTAVLTSPNEQRTEGIIGGASVPQELFGSGTISGGVPFEFGKKKNAIMCEGQNITLPEDCKGVYLLAASVSSDKLSNFTISKQPMLLNILSAREEIGAWDLFALGETGYIKRETLGFTLSHLHGKGEDLYGAQCNFFKYYIPTEGAKKIALPDDEDIIIIAATAVKDENAAKTATEMYDNLEKRDFGFALPAEELASADIGKIDKKKGKFKFIKNYAVNRINFELGIKKNLHDGME